MLSNAAIQRIDRRTGADPTGAPRITEGSALAGVRCLVASITARQRHVLGATIEDADQTVHVRVAALDAAGEADPAPDPGDKLQLRPDGDDQDTTATIIAAVDHLGRGRRGLSHLELFVRTRP